MNLEDDFRKDVSAFCVSHHFLEHFEHGFSARIDLVLLPLRVLLLSTLQTTFGYIVFANQLFLILGPAEFAP